MPGGRSHDVFPASQSTPPNAFGSHRFVARREIILTLASEKTENILEIGTLRLKGWCCVVVAFQSVMVDSRRAEPPKSPLTD
jgi:hypothetical protein